MIRVHIGHHFFGAGNLGDDWMLAGFLEAWRPWLARVHLTCPTPNPLEPLRARFPEIAWLPYDEPGRRASIAECDAWLGLGGSPFQCAVSRWFVDHLERERELCREYGRPMFFLAVGGQDREAYRLPETRRLCEQAERIWCRDEQTSGSILQAAPRARVDTAADLAHVMFASQGVPPAREGRLAVVLNFDWRGWPGLGGALEALARHRARERVWLAQESRPLPGAELWLYEQLPEAERARWSLSTEGWASGEWLLASRFHATLAAAWAGTRAAVLSTNEKLAGVAKLLGYPLLPLDCSPEALMAALDASTPPAQELLARQAARARKSCVELAGLLGLG